MKNRTKQRRDTTTSTHTLMTKKTARLLHQGARKWNKIRKTMKNTIRRKNSLWIPYSYPLFLTHGSSCVTKKVTKSLTHVLALTTQLMFLMSQLTASAQTASSSGRFTIPSRNSPQGSEVRFAKRTAKLKTQRTRANG